MVSRRLATKAGVFVGVGAVSAFGAVTPAQAYTCDITIDPTEDALRTAIADGDTTICINSGTMDLGTASTGGADNIIVDSDITLVGLGDVIIDGGNEAPGFITGRSNTEVSFDITVDNLVVQNFHDWNYSGTEIDVNTFIPVVGFSANVSGTVTVLNSRFLNNNSYVSTVGVLDEDGLSNDGMFVTVDNSAFVNNFSEFYATVNSYGDLAVSNTTFIGNSGEAGAIYSTDLDSEESTIDVRGNYFGDNYGDSQATVYIDANTSSLINNTFENNSSNSEWGGVSNISFDTNALFAFNTLVGNDSFNSADLWVEDEAEGSIYGNIFDSAAAHSIELGGNSATLNDLGANFSTGDDSGILTSNDSFADVEESTLGLSDATDNGGSTYTVALGAASVAKDVATTADVTSALGFSVATDQRGFTRDSLVDAGAWDSGPANLANTGVDAQGIAVAGGALVVTGVALAARRRRNA